MKVTDRIHRSRVVVAGGVLAAGLGVGLLVPFLLDAGAEPSRPPVTTPDTQPGTDPDPGSPVPDGRHDGAVLAAYVGPPELVFAPRGATDTVSLPVAGDVVVTILDPSGDPVEIDYDSFTITLDGSSAEHSITVDDGLVVRIEQTA